MSDLEIALEDRIFTLKTPSAFYSMFGALGGAISADLAVEAFEDDVKIASRSVSTPCVTWVVTLMKIQILNLLATTNEHPYIRYYQPSHHPPLGPLAQSSSSSRLSPMSQQQQQPQSLRWRSAMGGSNGNSRVAEPMGEYLSKKIAVQVQNDLDEYTTANPEFPVGCFSWLSDSERRLTVDRHHLPDRKPFCSSSTGPWTPSHPFFTNFGIKPWSMTCYQ